MEATAAAASARWAAGHGDVAIALAEDALVGLTELAEQDKQPADERKVSPATVLAAWQVAGVLCDAEESELAQRAEQVGRTLLDRYAARVPAAWERVRAVMHRHDAVQAWRRGELDAAATADREAVAAWGRLARRRPWRIRSIRPARAERAADLARVMAAQGDLSAALHVASTMSLRGLRAGSGAYPRWQRAYAAILFDVAGWYQATDQPDEARMSALYATRAYVRLPTARTDPPWLDDKRGLADAVQTAACCGVVMAEREGLPVSTYFSDEQMDWALVTRREIAAATDRSADRAALIDALLLAVRWDERDEQDSLAEELRTAKRSKRLGRMRELVELSERLAHDTTEQDPRAMAWWNHARIAGVLASTLAEDGSDDAARFFDRAVAGGAKAPWRVDPDTAELPHCWTA